MSLVDLFRLMNMGGMPIGSGPREPFAARMAARDAARAQSRVQTVQMQLRRLEQNLAKALLINEALWELIREHHGLTTRDLYDKLYEVDMRDGELDGKNQRKPGPCPQCGRTVSARHAACIYCGHVLDTSVFTLD